MSDPIETVVLRVAEGPIRLCCFQAHSGPMCPDGKVMCTLCFGRFSPSDLNVLKDGSLESVCRQCAVDEAIGGGG